MEKKLYDAASQLPETSLDFDTIQPTQKKKPKKALWKAAASLAACFLLLISIGFLSAEAKEYDDALRFFEEYGLSSQGLRRVEIKAVYRDIATRSFTYEKTPQVIANSFSAEQIGGYEIRQEMSTPEDVENLWNYKNFNSNFIMPQQQSIRYSYRSEYIMDEQLGFEVHHKSFLEKHDGNTLLWSVEVREFWIEGYSIVSDGVIAYGSTPTWSSQQTTYAWMAKIDFQGNLLWKHKLNNGFADESIAAILENADGSYGVFSRGDYRFFCLSQYTKDGKELHFKKTDIGNYGIWNAARLAEGYIVQLGSHMTNEHARIVKVDQEGNITEDFSYSSEDAYYYITDMIAYNGNIYLSAYCVPKLEDETQSAGGRYEIAGILNYLHDNEIFEIPSEKLTPMVQEHYTAILLVCDPKGGSPQEFFCVKGSLGGKLSLSDSGMLLWDTEAIATTYFSPYTSSFTIGGTCYVYRYTFDSHGTLVEQVKTEETAIYRR